MWSAQQLRNGPLIGRLVFSYMFAFLVFAGFPTPTGAQLNRLKGLAS
jgi:hypothetical protein